MGNIKLSALISDGMVLQRETENKLWGYAEPGKVMRLVLGTYQREEETGADGYFELTLPAMPAGGPWKILLSDGVDTVTIHDVLFGDVFLLGGQSNMELPIERTMERYRKEIERTREEEIRMFEVPKEHIFGEKREEIEKGRWMKAKGEDLQLFSAVGYFAAKELHESESVPIGLLQTAVGGTPVKAWCSEETVCRLGYDVAELQECKPEGYPKRVEEQEAAYQEEWWKQALSKDTSLDRKGTIELPGFFEETELKDFCGSIRLKKSVVLPEEINWDEEEVTLYLGALIDADLTYINGEKIGETAYRYPPRIYPVSKGILHAGENEIMIEMLVFDRQGAFMPGKEYALCYGGEKERQIALTGAWSYEIIRNMEEMRQATFFQYKAAGLYQGMLYPIRKWQVKGCFFYQGESNTGRPETYTEELAAMLADWRALWKNEKMPFIYVQLAGYADGKAHTTGTGWAKLREAQKALQEEAANVKMVQAYDLGEYNDLHPTDKKSVGARIALAAEKLIYGKNVCCENTQVAEIHWKEHCAELTFAPVEICLHIATTENECEAGNEQKVHGFEVLYENGMRESVEAVLVQESMDIDAESEEIQPNTAQKMKKTSKVIVQLPENKNVVALSYAWNDCPMETNLYNEAGLPVVPFEVKK